MKVHTFYGATARRTRSEDSADHASSSSSGQCRTQMKLTGIEYKPRRRNWCSPGVMTVGIGLLTLFTLSLFVEEKKVLIQHNTAKHNIQWLQLFGEDQMLYTLRRSGYDPLFYFNPSTASSYLKYKILDGYVGIIEPYVPNELYVYGADATAYYEYQLCNVNDDAECFEGVTYYETGKSTVSVQVGCTAYEVYNLVVIKRSTSSSEVVETSQGQLMCMNVRREMRELSYEDQQLTMDTMKVLWEVDDATGEAKFGEAYKSANYLLEFHFYNAAWQTGDHIHEGLGFIPQHLKLTNIFENSLRAVNPAVSLPYWDYTIETAANVSVWDSPVFQADTFGSLAAPPDEYWGWTYASASVDAGAIPDGRWAGATTGVNEKFPDLRSAYGNMRAPWSMNPSKYITRFTSADKILPTCGSHYQLLEYKTFAEFLHWSPYAPHGSTHGSIGGIYGCDALDSMLKAGYLKDADGQRNLCKNWIFYLKELYRAGTWTPRKDCAMNGKDASLSTCGFQCNTKLKGEMKKMLYMILNSDYEVTPMPLKFDDMEAWTDFVCDGDGYKVFAGDHLESASAADPSFWPIHPTLDRLLQAKFMSGGWETPSSWPEDVFDKTNYLCDKASCFHSSVNALSLDDACCYGHHLSDKMLSYDAATGQTVYVGPTNEEVLVMGDPTSTTYSMPYIYSNFAWEHCQEIKVDLNYLLDKLAYANLQDPTGAYTATTTTSSTTTGTAGSGSAANTAASVAAKAASQGVSSTYAAYAKWFATVTTVTHPAPITVTPAPALPTPVTTSQPMGGSESEATETADVLVPVPEVIAAPETAAVVSEGVSEGVSVSGTEAEAEKKSVWKTLVSWLLSPFSGRTEAVQSVQSVGSVQSVQSAEMGVTDAVPATTPATSTTATATATATAGVTGTTETVMTSPASAHTLSVNKGSSSDSADVMPDVIAAVDAVKIDHTVVSSDSSATDSTTDSTTDSVTDSVTVNTPSVADVLPDVIAAVDSVKIDHVEVKADAPTTTAATTTTTTATASTASTTATATAIPAVAASATTATTATTAPLPDAGVVADTPIGTTPPRTHTTATTTAITPATSTVSEEKVTEVAARVSLKLGTITSVDPHAHTTTTTATSTADVTAESRRLRHR